MNFDQANMSLESDKELNEFDMTSSHLLVPHTSTLSSESVHLRRNSFEMNSPQLEVTVLRAHNLPRLKTMWGKKRPYYVSVTDGTTTRKTKPSPSVEQSVEWNEKLAAFAVPPASHITISLYASHSTGKDQLTGMKQIPLESREVWGRAFRGMKRASALSDIKFSSSSMDELDVESNTTVELLIKDAKIAVHSIKASETCHSIIARIQLVLEAVRPFAEVHSFAQLALNLLSIIPNAIAGQFEYDNNIRRLLDAIDEAFDFVQDSYPLGNLKPKSKQTEILTLMLRSVCDSSRFIQSYAKDTEFAKRFLKHIDGRADEQINQYCRALERLRFGFLDHAAITTEVAVLQTQVDVKILFERFSDKELDATIREIPYGIGTRYNPDKGCLHGTRVEFLDYIVEWVNNPNSERGLLLLGQAGTGKSSIAHEVAHRFDLMHLLTTSFIFLRREQSKRKPYHLFTTMARDLADREPSFKVALGKAIKDDTSRRVGARDYRTLFEYLLLRPLKNLRIVGPVLVIIDALDESGDSIGSNGLHTFLANRLSELPSNFRFLITSRPEQAIEEAFSSAPSIKTIQMNDPRLAASTNSDIRTYFEKELTGDMFQKYVGGCCVRLHQKPSNCLHQNQLCKEFVEGFYQLRYGFGSIAKSIQGGPRRVFTTVYSQHIFRSVMGPIFAVSEPLSISSLTLLRKYAPVEDSDDDEFILAVVGHLGALLTNTTTRDSTLPIVPLHTSFRDFLTDQKKSGKFYINLDEAHHQLAHSCLALMLHDLKFNICQVDSSYLANNDLPNVESCIADSISPALSYACRFWDDHLKNADFSSDLFTELQSLIAEKFLFWLEVLSLTNSVHVASPALLSLQTWLALASKKEEFRVDLNEFQEIVKDSSAFVRYFGMAIAKSAPHIYISALPFTPSSSYISQKYSSMFPNTLSIKYGRVTHWPAVEMVIYISGISTRTVAFSPDGQRIVSGSDDATIRVWNAATGELEGIPITGHGNWIMCAVFSPDGQRILSGSDDGTVCIWNAATGEIEGSPFTGHTDSVISVAFSPDGQYITSSSHDHTICVWNVEKAELVTSPYTGHAGGVNSVAFSSDGCYIVSGSDDCTLRVWNTFTGGTVGDPLTGHKNYVNSVAFSPDGRYIVSGSSDNTIRVWSIRKSKMKRQIRGHVSSVKSVAFSPDGRRILSGSSDGTIRVWNPRTGETEAGPFIGHSDWVMSVAFSPDGKRIVSGSHDGTVRLWNAATVEKEGRVQGRESFNWSNAHQFGSDQTGQGESITEESILESARRVKSVAFSPDGQRIASGSTDHTIQIFDAAIAFSPDGLRIVSGSDDHTVRVWNPTTGEMIGSPFIGHTDSVKCVAFSPDGRYIASSSDDHTICIWDTVTGKIAGKPFIGHTDWVKSVAFSPDGRQIVSGSSDNTARIWDVETGKMEGDPFTGYARTVSSVAFSPDGRQIASGSFDGTITILSAETRNIEGSPVSCYTTAINFNPFAPGGQPNSPTLDSQLLRMSSDATGDTIGSQVSATAPLIKSVVFSPDGERIAFGSSDGTVGILTAATGFEEGILLTGHTNWVNSVQFSPDGKYVVSGSRDGTVRLWDISKSGEEDKKEVDFTDDCVMSTDGWIMGSNGELLVWVPDLNRECLHRPSTMWIAGGHETRLDLARFVHGPDWAACIRSE
ncbi:quinon protein alcohol dehydrogenase-like superfamily [Gymnopilus junonius]|uniref:Quinon protein alcohol dehydrogenase-like superfamily n=1 Tax=Gymnopilus junonius TaxID=109634 RepID=A0A9P5NBD4_GYMJU|nr:quinon protein alcohol dehydrogenase-like superfamily [Gymnopilus junonius]